jgi:GNAT superfamily N-acetyltransferase
MDVHASDRADDALDAAGAFLRGRPVEHNLVLSLLAARAASPEPGRYWWVSDGLDVVAVLFQSPPTFSATITPAPPGAIAALVAAVADENRVLPGVTGDAATAAAFAGGWTERRRVPGEPVEGQRLYRLGSLVAPAAVDGSLRTATPDDRPMLLEWTRGFCADTGMPGGDVARQVDARMSSGRYWIWEDGGTPLSSASASPIVAGVSRVGAVYTPPELRGRGFAAACVAAVSAHITDVEGAGAILYTQLRNPTSNAIYQRLGYEPVGEIVSYRFG